MKRTWKLQYEFTNVRINCFTWCQYSSSFIHFYAFKIWYYKKQHMYCFFRFSFINVIIFVINTSGSSSTFVGVDLEYLDFLRYDRSSWSELRYFNFEPSLKLWWLRARDFDGSQIQVTSSDLRKVSGFSRFLSFEISKLPAFMWITIFTINSNMNYC